MPHSAQRVITFALDRKFTGQCSEEASLGSLYDYGARFYSPALGRFIQADGLVPEPVDPQSLNRYAYALNNPLRYTDPSGMFEQTAIEVYLQSLDPDSWQDTLKQWMQDQTWWAALMTAGAGDSIVNVVQGGAWQFARFEGEGTTKLTGVSLTNDIFSKGSLGEAKLTDVYGGSLGTPAAIVALNQAGKMAGVYGLNGYQATLKTVSKGESNAVAFMTGLGLASAYAFIATETAAAWVAKTLATTAVGTFVLPELKCGTAECAGDQQLTVSMAVFYDGGKDGFSYEYWAHYGEIGYHENKPTYRNFAGELMINGWYIWR